MIQKAVEDFEIVMESDSDDSEIWAVKPIKLYSSRILIDSPEEAVASDTGRNLRPTATYDCWSFGHTGSLRAPPYIITKCVIRFWHLLRCYVAKSQLRNPFSNFVPMTRRPFT